MNTFPQTGKYSLCLLLKLVDNFFDAVIKD